MSTPGVLRVDLAVAAAVLLLLELSFSIVRAAISLLSPVALRRMDQDSDPPTEFWVSLHEPSSPHRIAVGLARQLCLGSFALLTVVMAQALGLSIVASTAVGLGAMAAVLGLELVLAGWLAAWNPRMALGWTAFLIRPAHFLFYPVVVPAQRWLTRMARVEAQDDERRDEGQGEEVDALIEVGERQGLLEASEGKMMRGIVDLDETDVREIMTPRTDIVALPVDATLEQARRAFLEAGHARLPVYRGAIDDIVGVLHVRDLLRAWGEPGRSVAQSIRDAMFVPETRSVADLLAEMRLKTHLALVVDEYGGIAGLVTLEDVIEEIVGEIREEHEQAEPPIREVGDGSWIIDGATHVEELEGLFGVEFEDRDFDTVGGLVVSELGRVPPEGEILEVRQLRIEVCKADRRRIRQVRVRSLVPPGHARARP